MSGTKQDQVFGMDDYAITDTERKAVHRMVRDGKVYKKYSIPFLALTMLSGFFAGALLPGEQLVNPPAWVIVLSLIYIASAFITAVKFKHQVKTTEDLFAERILPQVGFKNHKLDRLVWFDDESADTTRTYLLDLHHNSTTRPANDDIIQCRITV